MIFPFLTKGSLRDNYLQLFIYLSISKQHTYIRTYTKNEYHLATLKELFVNA